ncbi:MAG: hypothetical protein J7M01_03815 [Candidatus Marinimicrobia bacterium]|nr:hypothetical protein [Candidatus Neomarinimicrobiota bacterium]
MQAQSETSTLLPNRPDIDVYIKEDQGFLLAFLRSLSAIATSDRTITLAEYEAISQISEKIEQSALATHSVFYFLEQRIDIKSAFSNLSRASALVNEGTRRTAFNVAQPLLLLQGGKGKKIAQKLGKALKISLAPSDFIVFVNGMDTSVWKGISRLSARFTKGGELIPLADECFRLTGDPGIAAMVANYLDGNIEQHSLYTSVVNTSADLVRQLEEFEKRLEDLNVIEQTAQAYVETAEKLFQQTSQRLSVVEARIYHEKSALNEDFEDIICDAGNAIELEIAERLKTDSWNKSKVWKSIAKSTFGRELERRLDRLTKRREEQLRLMKEDLRLFQEDLRIVNASILEVQHHTKYAKLMPSLRITTRALNAADDIAGVTLGVGAVSALGTGTAAYFLGVSVVLPVVAPIAPFVGGAILVAGLFKWFSDGDGRKEDEIHQKREVSENILREQLEVARTSFFTQLDTVGEEFRSTANAFLKPLLLEADAARQLAGLQQKVARRAINDARQAITNLSSTVSRINSDKGNS